MRPMPPVSVKRTYRPEDSRSRPFGIGSTVESLEECLVKLCVDHCRRPLHHDSRIGCGWGDARSSKRYFAEGSISGT